MEVKCPKCDNKFEAKGYSEGYLAAWGVFAALMGIALGMVVGLLLILWSGG